MYLLSVYDNKYTSTHLVILLTLFLRASMAGLRRFLPLTTIKVGNAGTIVWLSAKFAGSRAIIPRLLRWAFSGFLITLRNPMSKRVRMRVSECASHCVSVTVIECVWQWVSNWVWQRVSECYNQWVSECGSQWVRRWVWESVSRWDSERDNQWVRQWLTDDFQHYSLTTY